MTIKGDKESAYIDHDVY